jgi:GNAT superfamily N-acetyltransferase
MPAWTDSGFPAGNRTPAPPAEELHPEGRPEPALGPFLRDVTSAQDASTSMWPRESAFDEVSWRDRRRLVSGSSPWTTLNPSGSPGGIGGWSGDPAKRELIGMWVAPSHSHRGVARRLLNRVDEWARSEGSSTLNLSVRQGNDGAGVAYLTMGMRPTGETRSVWNDPSDTIDVMELDLGSP